MTRRKSPETARQATNGAKKGPSTPPPYSGPQIAFCVFGIPRSGKNSQRQFVNKRTGARFSVKSKAAAGWLAEAVAQLTAQRGRAEAITGACMVSVDVYHKLPLSTFDSDNVVNLVYDALKHAHVIADDKAAIVRQGASMAYVDKANPRVEITIGPCTRPLAVAA
jgi:Holliday junction resolvase RusA-like endonuclease